jgi:hypothetical protein
MLLLLTVLSGSTLAALDTNEVFKWTGMTNCVESEGWELAAPSDTSFGLPIAMVDAPSEGGARFCRFDGDGHFLAIKSTGATGSGESEKRDISLRSELTISVWFRTSENDKSTCTQC